MDTSIIFSSIDKIPLRLEEATCIYDEEDFTLPSYCKNLIYINNLKVNNELISSLRDIRTNTIICIGGLYACNLGKLAKLMHTTEKQDLLLDVKSFIPAPLMNRRSSRLIIIPLKTLISCIDNILRVISLNKPYFYSSTYLYPDLIILDENYIMSREQNLLEIHAYLKELGKHPTSLPSQLLTTFTKYFLDNKPSLNYVISEALYVILGVEIGKTYFYLSKEYNKLIEEVKKLTPSCSTEVEVNEILMYIYRHPFAYTSITKLHVPNVMRGILVKLISLNY